MAKACLLLPCPGLDLTVVASLADVGMTLANNDGSYAYPQFTKGLAEYRKGNFVNAVDLMGRVIAAGGVVARDAQAKAVRAMAQARLGHPEAAVADLTRATDVFSLMPGPRAGDLGGDWTGWVTAHVLLAEAQALIQLGTAVSARDKSKEP
jgi:hypothetical protein